MNVRSIYFILYILLSVSTSNAADKKFESISDYNYNNAKNSIHPRVSLPPLPPKPSELKSRSDNPEYGMPKNKFVFTEDNLRAIDGLKLFAIQEIDKAIDQLRKNQMCYLNNVQCNKDIASTNKARLSQFKKSNYIFRRLIAAYQYLRLDKSQIDTKYNVHYLNKKILDQANLKKLRLSDREHRYTKFVVKKVHAQIRNNWTQEYDKFQAYLTYQRASPRHRTKLTLPEGKITDLGPMRLNQGFQVQKLRRYYLGQISHLVSKEPLLLFIDNEKVSSDSITAAYDRYIALQIQKTNIRDYNNNEDLVSLVQMYMSLPQERQQFKLDDGNSFTDLLAWKSLTEEVNRVLNNRKSSDRFINTGLMLAGAYAFFLPTFPAFGAILTIAWIAKGFHSLYKNNKLVDNDITYWLSGMQTYRGIIERKQKIQTDVVMIAFFGFALSPSITRIASAEKEFFTLKADDVETFMTNITEYAKARLKWKSKGAAASTGDFEDDIFDIYIETEGNLSFYIPKIVIDFNDYMVFNSGCLLSNSDNCMF